MRTLRSPSLTWLAALGELGDAPGDAVGEDEPDPDSGQQQKQGDHAEDDRKGPLDPGAAQFQGTIFLDHLAGLGEIAEHARIHEAADIEIGVVEAAEADQGAHPVLRVVGEDDGLAGCRLFQVSGSGQAFDFQSEAQPVRAMR